MLSNLSYKNLVEVIPRKHLERNDPHYNHYVDQYFQMFNLVRDPEI